MNTDEVERSMHEEKDTCQPGPIIRTTRPGKSIPRDPWIHRSKGMKCTTCMWFVYKESDSSTIVGRCRRHAPTMNGYPVVYGSDWCGDHKVDETRV